MRILRLPVDGRRAVDLHPRLSVVAGLDPEQAGRLRRAVDAITTGLAPPGGGLVEAHGLLLDATQDDLDLLDLATDPVVGVASVPTLLGTADASTLERLRTAERDVVLLATDRRWAAAALVAARDDDGPDDRQLARADHLRLALALHAGTDVEPLRRAVDADEDARRATGSPATGGLVDALAALGVDLRRRPVDADEVRRVADDLLDEHHRHAAWAVGAKVELDGLERALRHRLEPTGAGRPVLPESVERRLERATAAHADAVARADALRDAAIAERDDVPPAHGLDDAVLDALGHRWREHPAGTAPLLLDRVLHGLGDADVERLLERLGPATRGVQVVVVDDHPAAQAWVRRADPARAAVVGATPATAAGPSPTMPPTTQRRIE